MGLMQLLPDDWQVVLKDEFTRPYMVDLQTFLEDEWQHQVVFPPKDEMFSALKLTPYASVKVLLLGQDPYHDHNQAHGLCFSVRKGIKIPPSLRNIYKELQSDLGIPPASHGCLEHWARQGILMLNTVLTVRAHQAHSHRGNGWEQFTDAIIQQVNASPQPVIFVLWGGPAQQKLSLIDAERHMVITAPHPSPLSARRGFLGSRPFSTINRILEKRGQTPIDWQLPEDQPTFSF